MSPKSKSAPRELSAAQVQTWLEKHPNFLAGRPELLEQMQLPRDSDGTISFQAYQTRRLREHNAHLEALFQMASRNQKLIDHALILAAESLQDRPSSLGAAIQAQEKRLLRHFPNAGWAIRLRPEIPRVAAKYKIPEHPPLVRAIMTVFRKGPQILTDRETVQMLWPKSSADSDTLVIAPLKQRRRFGILCRELPPGIDREGDTTLLLHVADLTAALIDRFCEPRKAP